MALREDETNRRLMSGRVGMRELGGILLALGLLVLVAAFISGGRSELGGGDRVDRPALTQDHFGSSSVDDGYADYRRRYDPGAVLSDADAEPDPWNRDSMGLMIAGLVCVIGGVLIASRSGQGFFRRRLDD